LQPQITVGDRGSGIGVRDQEGRAKFRPSLDAGDLNALIWDAATVVGLSVNDFAVATLVKAAEAVLEQSHTTIASEHDRRAFMALLEDAEAKPSRALREAAKRYKRRVDCG
jgi:uncharacterized protein (DUF1778 family)